ncbi:MAG TPA: response regulator [Caulobacteraceae bacterium]|jgi:DNA-binding NtrC family response regulator|nr:response regulator [Caulobacteraceae bacterium]
MTAFSVHDEAAHTGPNVLVVEDEVMVRELIAETLRDAGCEVSEAANADEAVRALRATAVPDVLITDVKLPGRMNGVELAACVRRVQPRMKVIVTSGHASAENARYVADAFLAKPFELKQLVGKVRSLAADA